MVSFIDAHRDAYGVESICKQLPIAPSVYYEMKARATKPGEDPAEVASRPRVVPGDPARL